MRKFTITESILREWHNKFNALYFNNELPMPTFEFSTANSFYGQYTYAWKFGRKGGYGKIKMSILRDRDERGFQQTFIHEMIHQYQDLINKRDGHGRTFKAKANEINRIGGWEIERCSNDTAKVAEGMTKQMRCSKAKTSEKAYIAVWKNGNSWREENLWREIRPSVFATLSKRVVRGNSKFYKNLKFYEVDRVEWLGDYQQAVKTLGGYTDAFSKVAEMVSNGREIKVAA